MIYFTENLKFLRKRKFTKKSVFIEDIGFRGTRWSNFESGRSVPTLKVFIQIAKYFNINETDLIHINFQKKGVKPANSFFLQKGDNTLLLGENLKYLTKKMNKSQEEILATFGIAKPTFDAYKRGFSFPTFKAFIKMAKTLGEKEADLLHVDLSIEKEPVTEIKKKTKRAYKKRVPKVIEKTIPKKQKEEVQEETTSLISLAIFCGASRGFRKEYVQKATELGTYLAEHQIRMVFGGGKIGMMGAIADAMIAKKGRVVGVMPDLLRHEEVEHKGIDKMIISENMSDRKVIISKLVDGYIALPGGFGTLDEIFEALTLGQLGIESKPVGILNTNGFFDFLLQQLDKMVLEGFLKAENRAAIIVNDSVLELLQEMNAYVAPTVTKVVNTVGS